MPDDKKPDDKKRSNTETARRIWLAGIGAYGRAFTEAQEALKDVTGKGSEIFEELVQKGQVIEKVVEVKGKKVMDKAAVPNFDLDERIKAMRSRLSGGGDVDADFEDRLSVVEAKIDRILALLEPAKPKAKRPAKKTAKKASPKRAKTVRTKKPAAKKTPSRKTTGQKTTAKKAAAKK